MFSEEQRTSGICEKLALGGKSGTGGVYVRGGRCVWVEVCVWWRCV